jgi:organic hydroperoxide reductase OsmC/OhrA
MTTASPQQLGLRLFLAALSACYEELIDFVADVL